MPKTLDISIIIVSWNAKRFLLDCLESIRADVDHLARREIIVVDNASTDGSPDAVAEQFPEVILIREQSNLGFARANNVGIRRAAGRYLYLINSDVVVRPGSLDRFVAFMDENRKVGVSGPRVYYPDGRDQPSFWNYPTVANSLLQTFGLDFDRRFASSSPYRTVENHFPNAKRVQVLMGCFWVVRRSALEAVGLLDEAFFMYAEDMDWCRRFHLGGWDLVYVHEIETVHHGGGSSSSAPTRFFIEMNRSVMRYWSKHHGRIGKYFCAFNIALHQVVRIVPRLATYLFRPSARAAVTPKIQRSVACLRWVMHI